jgi:hypothetical protein
MFSERLDARKAEPEFKELERSLSFFGSDGFHPSYKTLVK